MAINYHSAATLRNQITLNMNTYATPKAKAALLHLERIGKGRDVLTNLKKMVAKGELSKSEFATHSKKLKSNLLASEDSVHALLDSNAELSRNIKMKQNNALNLLDDSASVLIAQSYKQASNVDKIKALQDPFVLGALNKSGSYISGMSEEALSSAVNNHFKNDDVIGVLQMEHEADKAVLKAISNDLETLEQRTFTKELDAAIEDGEEIASKVDTEL
jgi:hypothetical protein